MVEITAVLEFCYEAGDDDLCKIARVGLCRWLENSVVIDNDCITVKAIDYGH